MCGFFESLYMTCLDAKKLQENVKGYTEFPMVPLISQQFSLVKYIFSKKILWRLCIHLQLKRFLLQLSKSTSVGPPNNLYISTCLLSLLPELNREQLINLFIVLHSFPCLLFNTFKVCHPSLKKYPLCYFCFHFQVSSLPVSNLEGFPYC